MKKNLNICIWGLATVMMVSGCSKKADSAQDTTAVETTAQAGSTEASAAELPAVSEELKSALEEGQWVEKLGTYVGVTYTPLAIDISDEDIEAQLLSLVSANVTYEEVDRAAQEEDAVNIDYVGKKDGVAFEGGTASGTDLILGSGQFIDGFEDGLIGAEKGEKRTLNLTFPEAYPSEELAGAAVVFEVTVNAVKEPVKPEVNDEFIAAKTEYATVDEFRVKTREQMEESARNNALQQKKSDVFLKVVGDSTVNAPEEYVQVMYENQKLAANQQAQMYGMDLETMLSFYGMDMESFEASLRDAAEEGSRQNAVVHAIAKAERITVTEEDLVQLAEDFGYESKEAMIEQAGEDTVDNYVLTEKVVDFIAENAVEE